MRARWFTLVVLGASLAACVGRGPRRADSADAAGARGGAWADLPPLPCTEDAAYVVTGDGVGPVRVGALADDVARRCPSTDTTLSLGDAAPKRALVVSVGGGVVIALTAGGDSVPATITRVIVPAAGFNTAKGVGVESKVGQLRGAHGPICADLGEGAVVVAARSLPGVSFETSADYAALVPRQAELQPSAVGVPDTAQITQLWATGAGTTLCK